ncbi:MAG: alpha/beta hydrolase family protein [Candidatus Coproplasma sp.]
MSLTLKKIFSFVSALALTFCLAFVFAACDDGQADTEPSAELSYTVVEMNATRDGLNIYGKLYAPKESEGKLPAVVLSHSANLTADSMNSYAAGFAERGFVAFAFDFCGGSSKSRSDGNTDDMTIFTECADLKAAISAVSALEFVDGDRIYLFGTSQGGFVTAITAEECADVVKGEILLYPAFNIPELTSFSGFSGLGSFGSYGQAFYDTLKDYDAYEHIGNFSGRVLIIHGSSDFIVNKSYSERAASMYSDCTLYIIQGAGHGFNSENYSFGGNYDKQVWTYIDQYLTAEQ